MTTQTVGLSRNTLDKYYTKNEIVDLCLSLVKNHLKIEKEDIIIEPSAGNGAFISGIKELSNNCLFYDINPEHKEIKNTDFLTLEVSHPDKIIHIIGNPPFGRQSSLAIKFIKKSCMFCDTISFILPRSFKKDSLQKNFPLHFHLIFQKELPEKSFLVNGEEYDVPCVFQIWKKKEIQREQKPKLEPKNFSFVKKTEHPDISFRRVGVYAGKIDTNIEDKSIQSHYFIKFNNKKPLQSILKKLKTITYEFDNTTGPKSISKQELIYKFNPLL